MFGRGPIATYAAKDQAEADAAALRQRLEAGDIVAVIERSHGKRFVSA